MVEIETSDLANESPATLLLDYSPVRTEGFGKESRLDIHVDGEKEKTRAEDDRGIIVLASHIYHSK